MPEYPVFCRRSTRYGKGTCSPYFLNTESSATQVHCQRLRVASLLLAAAPQWDQHLHAQASESFEPGAFGERAEQTRGQVSIPAPYAAQFRIGAAPEQRRTHHPDDFPQELVPAHSALRSRSRGLQAAPGHRVLEGLGGVLRLAAISCEALLRFGRRRCLALACCLVSLRERHGALLRFVWVFCD